jgi:hypothetical protein
MTDGEARLVIAGEAGAAALFDFYAFMARSTWIASDAELSVRPIVQQPGCGGSAGSPA